LRIRLNWPRSRRSICAKPVSQALSIAEAGLDTFNQAGYPLEASHASPPDSERIDYLFFVHDRHEGNLDAARAYLAWETGLIAQCAPDELQHFRIDAQSSGADLLPELTRS